MKLNRRGYLTVEIILASVVAIAIALFLMEITIKLVNVTDDAFVDTELLTDKALIIENIQNRLQEDIDNNGGIKYVMVKPTSYLLYFRDGYTSPNYRLAEISINNTTNTIKYEPKNYSSEHPQTIYEKKLNSSLKNISITSNVTESAFLTNIGCPNTGCYFSLTITADNKFSKEPFEANIIVYTKKRDS